MSANGISREDLLAFADGKLDAARRVEVETYISNDPEAAAEIALWQRQNEAISALFGPVASERIPSRLEPRRIAAEAARPSFLRPALAFAAVVMLTIGLGGGWLLRDLVDPTETASEALVDGAVTAHALYVKENRHAVEVAAADRQHLVTWLSNRIETQIDAPDISAEGFTLIGGRLLPTEPYLNSGPAAQLMYENAAAERVTVYITGPLPDAATAYEFVKVAGLDAFYWANAEITCTVVGELPEALMQTIARKVYQQLTRRPDTAYVRGG